jgi:hypothetical protein
MIRTKSLLSLALRAALALSTVPAAAQQTGGEALAPEVLSTPGAAELIRERAFTRLQVFQAVQALRPGAAAVTTAVNPNAGNPALDRSAVNQQALARVPSRGDAGFLAGFSGGQPLASSRVRPPPAEIVAPTFIDKSKTLVVNAFGSPVSIGNGNVVQQQVANSTAISVGGPASATAAADNPAGRGNHGGTGAAQSATSSAASLGAGAGPAPANGTAASRGTAR